MGQGTTNIQRQNGIVEDIENGRRCLFIGIETVIFHIQDAGTVG